MAQQILINKENICAAFEVDDKGNLRLLHFGNEKYADDINEEEKPAYRPFEMVVSDEPRFCYGIGNYFQSFKDDIYLYRSHREYETELGTKLEFLLEGREMQVRLHYQFVTGTSVVRSWMEVTNIGDSVKTLEYVSSFALTGICRKGLLPYQDKTKISIPHNAWSGEMRWKDYSMADLGMSKAGNTTFKRICCSTCGTWSSGEYLPMGYVENTETGQGIMWQIEHNGSWYWEMSDYENLLYLNVCGPNDKENHWFRNLKKDETFVSVPVAVCAVSCGFTQGCRELTRYRRKLYRKCADIRELPVIFNDWMNGLAGDQRPETLIPLIDAAAEAGCEYFCMDAGWYVEPDGEWDAGMGEWLPSAKRFPNGIKEITDYIRSKGMLPGMWLEIEVVAYKSKLVKQVPSDWFFCRHGHPVVTNGRYQLDFRNPEVIKHADAVVDRMVGEYGVAYIKMDYNHNAGIGTEVNADSEGDGLLQHTRAYINWLDSVFARYPDLIIENCGSGGMRIDYALLSRHSIQSVTDSSDYRKTAFISAASAAALTPEQAGIWTYPVEASDEEETICNMVNAMLMRIHLGGRIDLINSACTELVKEAIACYKEIRSDIPKAVPVWPLGFPRIEDGWISFGLDCGQKLYLAVWRLESSEKYCAIPLESVCGGENITVRCIYPKKQNFAFQYHNSNRTLEVKYERQYCARLFEVSWRD